MGLKKKLHAYKPKDEPVNIETQRTSKKIRIEPADDASVERSVRQLLADKVSGNMMGIWLLIPEHLRLGTYDMLLKWTNKNSGNVEPRLALQGIHESALCVAGIRKESSLNQKGFELANGLPFVATHSAIHKLYDDRTMEETCDLQVMLGMSRKALGDFFGETVAIDPHLIESYSKRQMRLHKRKKSESGKKAMNTYFCIDTQTSQPICFTLANPCVTVAQGVPNLLSMAKKILNTENTLVLSDKEHCNEPVFDFVLNKIKWDHLSAMPQHDYLKKRITDIPAEKFKRHWAGLATVVMPYNFDKRPDMPLYHIIQRCGETRENFEFKSFLSTSDKNELNQISYKFPDRWHIEEFINKEQAYGWNRAGTFNLNIRYAGMTMALMAQAVIRNLLKKIGKPYSKMEASNLAKTLFMGIDGDLRVKNDTIIVTYYNAPESAKFREIFTDIDKKLESENIDPRIPFLYGFKIKYVFK